MSHRGKPFGRNNSKGYFNHPFRHKNEQERNIRTALAMDSAGFGGPGFKHQGGRYDSYNNRFDPINRGRNNRKRGGRHRNNDRPRPLGGSGRDQNFCWYKITVPFGKKLSKEFLLKSLMSCSQQPFTPMNYHILGNSSVFFVDSQVAADALRQCNRRITTPDGSKVALHISTCPPPQSTLNKESVEKLKVVMSSRYNTETHSLNLQNFQTDAALKEEGLHMPLTRSNVMIVVMKIITEHIPQLQSLDLSYNRLINMQCTNGLATTCKNLKSLNLKKNSLNHMSDLNQLKGVAVEELILDGNPLCDHYKDQATYISDVRSKFPKVVKLDGQDLPPPIVFDLGTSEALPDIKGSFLPSPDVSRTVFNFLETYYGIYDSENRQPLLEAYQEDAVYSMSVAKHPGRPQEGKTLQEYLYDFGNRNLIKITDPGSREKVLRQGRIAIISQLCSLPRTQHFPNTITVDVSHLSATLMMFTVAGLFKEVGTSNTTIKAFTRNFLVVPHENGIHIVNELHMVTSPTGNQIKTHRAASAAAPTVDVAPPPVTLPSSQGLPIATPPHQIGATTEDQKQQLMMQLSTFSGMNIPFAAKCLEEQNWDLQGAMAIFTELTARGGIPPEAFQPL